MHPAKSERARTTDKLMSEIQYSNLVAQSPVLYSKFNFTPMQLDFASSEPRYSLFILQAQYRTHSSVQTSSWRRRKESLSKSQTRSDKIIPHSSPLIRPFLLRQEPDALSAISNQSSLRPAAKEKRRFTPALFTLREHFLSASNGICRKTNNSKEVKKRSRALISLGGCSHAKKAGNHQFPPFRFQFAFSSVVEQNC